MAQAVLIVEQDDARRSQLRAAFSSRGVPVYEVADAVDAMVAIGRADFGALLASEGKRHLSLRGLCLLARRRHPGIRVSILASDDSAGASLPARLGLDVDLIPQDAPAQEIVDAVVIGSPSLLPAFELPAATDVYAGPSFEEPRTDSASAPRWRASGASGQATTTAPEPPLLYPSEPTMRMVRAPREDFAEPTLTDDETELEVPSLDDVEPVSSGTGDGAAAPRAFSAEATVVDVDGPSFGMPLSLEDSGPHPWPGFAEPADTDPTSGPSFFYEQVLLEGELEQDGNAALLMGIFAQELTGRLDVSTSGRHTALYFHVGEPVGATHPMGDAGFFEALRERGVVAAARRPSAPEGELFSALVAQGALSGDGLHEFLRAWLEESLEGALSSSSGSYRFVENHAFLETWPLCRVDLFATLRRHVRRRLEVDLGVEAARLARHWVEPAPSLAVCAPRILAFTGGLDLAAVLGDGAAVSTVLEALRLDRVEGTLLLLTLEAAHLVELRGHPPLRRPVMTERVLLDTAPTVEVARVPDADDSSGRSADEEALREEIFSLYMRLKPLTRPAHVLGVALGASRLDVDRAYEERMALLDLERLTRASGDLVRSRVVELRAKVSRAYEALVLQHESSDKMRPARTKKDDKNPW